MKYLSYAATSALVLSGFFSSALPAAAQFDPLPQPSPNASLLILAGGGGGGGASDNLNNGARGGGGGAGGALPVVQHLSVGTYAVTVGNGGAGGAPGSQGLNGQDSSFGNIVAHGGGGGGFSQAGILSGEGSNGGSGGGGGGGLCHSSHTGGLGMAVEGNRGGIGGKVAPPTCVQDFGGGGGGASDSGTGVDDDNGGHAGFGIANPIALDVVPAVFPQVSQQPYAYIAFGGQSGGQQQGNVTVASPNLGNGGWGGYINQAGGPGGAGLVMISYPTGTITATGGTVVTHEGNTIHIFTSSGTFVVTSLGGTPAPVFVPTQPVLPPANTICSNIGPSVKNLVFVTHGWNDKALVNSDWVMLMASNIRSSMPQDGTWGVCTFDWHVGADTGLFSNPNNLLEGSIEAYNNAKPEGVAVGNYLAARNFDSVHFIAHSAGSNLIQTAAEIEKLAHSNVKIQLTFLDAYDPTNDLRQYGQNPITKTSVPNSGWWAEQYVDKRGEPTLTHTNLNFNNSFNVDVTALDAQQGMQPTETIVDYSKRVHAWPRDWYAGSLFPGHTVMGFPQSIEGGTSPYPFATFRGGDRCVLLSDHDSCVPGTPQYFVSQVQNPFVGDILNNGTPGPTGTVNIHNPFSFGLTTGSPVWLTDTETTTLPENVLSFDYQFTSAAGAQGVLTVFVDGNVVDIIDERNVDQIKHTEINVPVGDLAPGTHTIQFRLDPFTDTHSSIEISNIKLGLLTQILVTDNTPPEAKISVNPLTQDLLVVGTDTQGATTVTKDAAGNYTVTDLAGNTTKLVFSKTYSGKVLTYAKLTGIKYNQDATTTVSTSSFLYVWDNKKTPPALVSQTIAVNDTYLIQSLYDVAKNKTTVIILKKGLPVSSQSFVGLKVPALTTLRGVIGYQL